MEKKNPNIDRATGSSGNREKMPIAVEAPMLRTKGKLLQMYLKSKNSHCPDYTMQAQEVSLKKLY